MFRRFRDLAVLFPVALVAVSAGLFGCESDPASPAGDEGSTDTTPPTVRSIDPIDGAMGVGISSPVRVVFSEAMDPASLADASISLRSSGGAVATTANLVGNTLTLTPDVDLAYSTDYSVSLGTDLTDLAGNALVEVFESAFTTFAELTPVTSDVRYVGRFDDSDPNAVRFSWSGTGFVVRFNGTSARATLRGGSAFTVVVDGEVQPEPLTVTGSDASYDLASGLDDGEHTIEVYRRVEALNGPTVVSGVFIDGEPLEVPAPTRQLEIVGDSWHTGFGVDPADPFCTQKSENHFMTWGAITARAVGAELSTVAFSGRGVVVAPIQDVYDRVVATEASSAGTIRPADAVLVSIGANDLDAGLLPGGFAAAYESLLEQIRARHADALIACIWPRLPSASETESVRTAIEAAVAARTNAGDASVLVVDLELEELVDTACDNYHPGAQSHILMADNAVAFLQSELGW